MEHERRQPTGGEIAAQNATLAADEHTPLLQARLNPGTGPSDAEESGTTNSGDDAVAAGTAPDADPEEERSVLARGMSTTRIALIMGTAWVGVFLGAIDSTIMATLSAPISSSFDSLSLLSWLATAYLIANAACQPISGRLTDIFGRGPGLVASNLLFAAGNLMCGLARDEATMIAGRVVAGLGGGGLMSISTFLGSDLVPLRRRGVVQGIGNICYGAGAMLGGVFGGFVNDQTAWGWRLAFLVQVPPVLVSAALVAVLVRLPPMQSSRGYLARIDFAGVFLTVSFIVLLLLGLNAGGNLVPWTHPLVLVTLPLSAATFAAFFFWESRARQPIIPVRLLGDRTVFFACVCNFLATAVALMGLFYVPLYLQVIGRSTTRTGLLMISSPFGVSICSVGSGYVMKVTGRYVMLGVGLLLMMNAGVFLYTRLGEDGPDWMVSVAFVLVGGGYGGMLTVTLLACIAAVDHSYQAVITSATYLARSMGATIGLTIAGAIYQNVLKARLWDRFGDLPDAAEQIRRIRDDLGELKHLPEGWHTGVIASFIEAFHSVWYTMLGFCLLALVCVSLMKQHTLHNTLERK